MLKTVSSITNAIGALNYKGTWNATTNTPTIVSSTGTKGDYYVVSVAGTTTIDGISNWGVGDWIAFNGAVWQRVEGGADLNGVNLSVSGTTTLSGLTASTALALNAGKDVVSVTNTGTGNNVLADGPTLTTPTLGVASATSINKVALTAPANGSTLTIADGKTLTANNSIALTGTDATTMTFPATNATIARTDAGQTFTGTQVFSSAIQSGTSPKSLTSEPGNATSAAVRTILYSTKSPTPSTTVNMDFALGDFDYTFPTSTILAQAAIKYEIGFRDDNLNYGLFTTGEILCVRSGSNFASVNTLIAPTYFQSPVTISGLALTWSISSNNLRASFTNSGGVNLALFYFKFMA